MKRNIALIAFLIITVLIMASFIYVFSLRGDNTFYLEDIKGSKDVLEGLEIKGFIQDKYHGNGFTITDGKVSKKFIYYDTAEDMKPSFQAVPTNIYGKYIYGGQYSYEIAHDADIESKYYDQEIAEDIGDEGLPERVERTTTVYADKVNLFVKVNRHDWPFPLIMWNKSPKPNYLQFGTKVYIKSPTKSFKSTKSEMIYEDVQIPEEDRRLLISENLEGDPLAHISNVNNLTELEGVQYITTPTYISGSNNYRCVGEAGIYKIEEFDHWRFEGEMGKVKRIVSIDLDEGRTQILGLHGIDDKLLLIMIVDNTLAIRSFDPKTGEGIDELLVPQFNVEGEMLFYNIYVDDNTLTLDFSDKYLYSEDVYNIKNSLKVLSVKVGERLELLHCIDDFDLGDRAIVNVSNMIPVDGRLTIFATLQDKAAKAVNDEGSLNRLYYDRFLYPEEFGLFVFDDASESNLIYQGEIITDAHEDSYIYRNELDTDVAYKVEDRRRKMAGIEVKGVGIDD
ncbi:MAG: hypothetical protein GX974_00730 [Clostridiales bacterium]|nr:hypothetical protein [Clostridiales bacterium]